MHHKPEKTGPQDQQCQRGYQPMLKICQRGKSNICRTLHHDSPTLLRYRHIAVKPITARIVCDEIASLSLQRIMRSSDETIIVFREIEKCKNPFGCGYRLPYVVDDP